MKVLGYIGFFLLSFQNIYADIDTFGYRGKILEDTSVDHLAIRSDGRYLFYSSSGPQFYVVDLQDFKRQAAAKTVDGTVLDLLLDGDQRLVVATAAGVQYFDVSLPFKPAEESKKFTRTNETNLSPIAACIGTAKIDNSKLIFYLEQNTSSSTDIGHLVRVVKETAELSPTLNWTALFAPEANRTVQPYTIRCAQNRTMVLGKVLNSLSEEINLRVSAISNASPGLAAGFVDIYGSLSDDYALKDAFLDESKNRLIAIVNRKTTLTNLNDSRAIYLDADDFSKRGFFPLGSDAKSGFSFIDKAGAIFEAFLVGLDELATASSESKADKLLFLNQSSIPTQFGDTRVDNFGDRGIGSADAGGSLPTLFASTKNDHYKYVVTEASGISLFTEAPKLTASISAPLTSTDGLPKLSAASPLSISLTPDREVTYQIYSKNDYPVDGIKAGLERNPGNLIKSGTLPASVATTIEVKSSDVEIENEGSQYFTIIAKATSNGSEDLLSRAGVKFNYDPPPGRVRNFRVGFGDRAVYVYFEPPKGGDLFKYYIYFSTTASDLENLETTSSSAITSKTVNTGVDGQTKLSPIILNAVDWKGRYVIFPMSNEQTVYVRVQSEDNAGQLSTDNPLGSTTPYPTLTIEQALGSLSSCSLNGSPTSEWALGTLLCLVAFAFLIQLKRKEERR